VYEDIPASTCGLNETIALLRVEPLHSAARHCRILQVSDQGLIAPRRRQANTGPCGLGGGGVGDGMPLGFETNNGPIRFDHEHVELIKGIDSPNGKAHFVVARETPINADMRVSSFRQ
jgi:hypothetical protein